MVGSWLRVIGSWRPSLFPVLLAGQTLCAICQCFTGNVWNYISCVLFIHVTGSAPNVIAARWFPDRERTSCVSIGTIMNQLGDAVCTMLLLRIVHSLSKGWISSLTGNSVCRQLSYKLCAVSHCASSYCYCSRILPDMLLQHAASNPTICGINCRKQFW